MPSFEIVSEVDAQEIDNALNQARKELATRFDFKGSVAEIVAEKDKITLTAEDASRLRGLREIVIGKLSKRGIERDRHWSLLEGGARPANRRAGRAGDFAAGACPPGVEDSTGTRRRQGE